MATSKAYRHMGFKPKAGASDPYVERAGTEE
jgi:hypothetical protein